MPREIDDGVHASFDPRPSALLLNGALPDDPEIDAVAEFLVELLESRGLSAGHLVLRDIPVAYCQGCFDCWVKTPGTCRTDDAGRAIAEAWVGADLAVLLTPVTFGGYSSQLKKALDRLLCTSLPFITGTEGGPSHPPRYEHRPALLGVGLLDADWGEEAGAEEERIFHRLVGRNGADCHAPFNVARVLPRGTSAEDVRAWLRPVVDQVARRLAR